MISLALHNNAFDASNLNNASNILKTKVWGQKQSMQLRWKESKLKCPVFRHIQRGILSDNEAMPYAKLNYDMGRQSLDAGFEKAWTPRFAQRGAANAADGKSVYFPRQSIRLEALHNSIGFDFICILLTMFYYR